MSDLHDELAQAMAEVLAINEKLKQLHGDSLSSGLGEAIAVDVSGLTSDIYHKFCPLVRGNTRPSTASVKAEVLIEVVKHLALEDYRTDFELGFQSALQAVYDYAGKFEELMDTE